MTTPSFDGFCYYNDSVGIPSEFCTLILGWQFIRLDILLLQGWYGSSDDSSGVPADAARRAQMTDRT
jgi:hypothetical protein